MDKIINILKRIEGNILESNQHGGELFGVVGDFVTHWKPLPKAYKEIGLLKRQALVSVGVDKKGKGKQSVETRDV